MTGLFIILILPPLLLWKYSLLYFNERGGLIWFLRARNPSTAHRVSRYAFWCGEAFGILAFLEPAKKGALIAVMGALVIWTSALLFMSEPGSSRGNS